MKTDQKLLELVSKAAHSEFLAWQERNQKKADLGKLLRQAGIDRCELSEDNFATEDWAEWSALIDGLKTAQVRLDTARARTRRIVSRLYMDQP